MWELWVKEWERTGEELKRGIWRVEKDREDWAGAARRLQLEGPSWELPLGSEQRTRQGLWLSQWPPFLGEGSHTHRVCTEFHAPTWPNVLVGKILHQASSAASIGRVLEESLIGDPSFSSSSILAWRIPWTEKSLVGYSPWGSQKAGHHAATITFTSHHSHAPAMSVQ